MVAQASIYSPRTFRSGDAVGALVGLARKALVEEFDRELAPLGLNTAQALVIVLVGERRAGTAADLCKRLSHDPGAMTRLVDKLERRELLRRVRAAGDRRAARLELTSRGRTLHAALQRVQVDVLNRMLRGFSRAEARQLEQLLRRMLANAAQPGAA